MTPRHRIRLIWTSLACLLLSVGVAAASDGVLEINQTCAVNTGCFSGDAAGFPVTITQPGSYRLTGALDVSGLPSGTTAVNITASYVTLDLNGFSIMGPSSCTGTGTSLVCTPGATGSLNGTGVIPGAGQSSITIRNGVIRGMTGAAISGDGVQVLVEDVHASENSGGGILVNDNSVVRSCLSRRNGGNGLDVGPGSVVESSTSEGNATRGIEMDGEGVLSHSVFRANGLQGVWANNGAVTVRDVTSLSNEDAGYLLAPRSKYRASTSSGNGASDDCGGGTCTEQRRYYLTFSATQGTGADTICAGGFKMASRDDILATASMIYDCRSNAYCIFGGGPSNFYSGWLHENSNCGDWLSSSSIDEGTIAALDSDPLQWTLDGTVACDTAQQVWCVEEE